MKKKLFCYLLFPLVVACNKQTAVTTLNLPEPDPVVIENTYPLVTAASSISLTSGSVYRLALVQYASFFTFDRSVKNGNLYYAAILKSAKQFTPLKFFILNNGTGQITAIAIPSKAEVEKFNKAWQR